MTAVCQVKALQFLRNNRIQLQCSMWISPAISGQIQIVLPHAKALELLGGELGLAKEFEIEVPLASQG